MVTIAIIVIGFNVYNNFFAPYFPNAWERIPTVERAKYEIWIDSPGIQDNLTLYSSKVEINGDTLTVTDYFVKDRNDKVVYSDGVTSLTVNGIPFIVKERK